MQIKENSTKIHRVSHIKIEIQLPKLWDSYSEGHWKSGKIEHENGLKFRPSYKGNI